MEDLVHWPLLAKKIHKTPLGVVSGEEVDFASLEDAVFLSFSFYQTKLEQIHPISLFAERKHLNTYNYSFTYVSRWGYLPCPPSIPPSFNCSASSDTSVVIVYQTIRDKLGSLGERQVVAIFLLLPPATSLLLHSVSQLLCVWHPWGYVGASGICSLFLQYQLLSGQASC